MGGSPRAAKRTGVGSVRNVLTRSVVRSGVQNGTFLLLTTFAIAACANPVEQDVTLRLTRGQEVVHASGTITEDPDTGRPSLVARFALDAGKTGVLLIHSDPPTVGLYEEWRGDRRLFSAEVIDESFAGRLTDARVGARIEFAFTARDAASGAVVAIRGAATVVEVRGAARPTTTSGEVVVVVEDEPDTYDEPSGCESYEPEPEPIPDEEEDDWESSDGGGCGGIEGDTVDDDWDEEDEWESDEWETDEDYESDDSASGCEGDTYESTSSALEQRRTRRMVRGAWLMLWPIGVITLFNRWARRRC